MKKIISFTLLILLSLVLFSCDKNNDTENEKDDEYDSRYYIYIERAKEYRDLVIDNYWDSEIQLLNHFYPDNGTTAFLWPYFSTMGLNYQMLQLEPDNEEYVKTFLDFVDGLKYYKTVRHDGLTSYSSGRGTKNNGVGDVYFDDNGWTAKKFLEAYERTGEEFYLEETIKIYDYLVKKGWSPLNGVYWCENPANPDAFVRGLSATTPLVYLGAKLYKITEDEYYLDWAKKALEFIDTLENPKNHVHWNAYETIIEDGEFISGNIDKNYWSYNSGFTMTSLVELYKVTNDYTYIEKALRTAKGANKVFGILDDNKGVRSYPPTGWFNTLLLQGYISVYEFDKDEVSKYIDDFAESIDYAWENERDEEGFLAPDWVTGWTQTGPRDVLDQTGIAEILASLAYHYKHLDR